MAVDAEYFLDHQHGSARLVFWDRTPCRKFVDIRRGQFDEFAHSLASFVQIGIKVNYVALRISSV
jgi:hypothetical protein